MSAQRRLAVLDETWVKLEKIWVEEGLTVRILSQRFGIPTVKINKYLRAKYGSARHNHGVSSFCAQRTKERLAG